MGMWQFSYCQLNLSIRRLGRFCPSTKCFSWKLHLFGGNAPHINIWNNLSTDCVHASSVNMFKNKIDKYLVKAGYT